MFFELFAAVWRRFFLQFLEIRYRVQIRDFAGLMDTIGAIVVAAVVLIMGTFWHEWCGIFIRSGEI